MSLSVNELRELFLDFFESRSHQRVRSSSLIPHNDPTLLFTNAGMNQFKDYFTGKESPSYLRAVTAQKCVRAGGKHNDLESVGFTKRHHTFFEMLGNFSFGDYFKKEAMQFAWEFLTEVVKFPKEKLWVSVFEQDDEAYDLWANHLKVPKERIVRMGEKDNFWAMGETGPCGPCSEIYFDRGPEFGNETIFDGGERYLEVWNLVFMQYERLAGGELKPLPKPSVDTGMGLERLASIVQNAESNYEIDSLRAIYEGFKNLAGIKNESVEQKFAMRVLTDHIRACTFLISDGVQPSSEGRGYVLRRILRRAIRYGTKCGFKEAFFYKGVDFVLEQMAEAYPELEQSRAAIQKIIRFEEEKFLETLESGLKLLQAEIQKLKKGEAFSGKLAFQLYDTFGFPLDLTEIILKENERELDHQAFEAEMEKQKERSRAQWKGSGDQTSAEIYHELAKQAKGFRFVGYEKLSAEAKILGMLQGNQIVEELKEGDDAQIILDVCPFYAESGGQVGDQGEIRSGSNIFVVEDTQNPIGSFHVLIGRLKKGRLKLKEQVEALVSEPTRRKTRINHTMTHVLHSALQVVLGDHIKQAGSLVHPDYLRFDFSHFQSLSREEIEKIEDFCNARIRENPSIRLAEYSIDEALKKGAKAFFEEKYGDRVRVLELGDFSMELCGGTHAESLSEAGLFKIVSESSVASGVRRVVAVTAQRAIEVIREEEKILDELSKELKAPPKELLIRVQKIQKERSELAKKKTSSGTMKAKDKIETINGVPVIIEVLENSNPKDLRPLADDLKNQIQNGVIILGTVHEGRASVVISVSRSLAAQFQTKNLVEHLGEALKGKGGGRDDFAQVGGSEVSFLTSQNLKQLLQSHLQSLTLTA
ncbi:MAG: alanine--tRNA ligase [Bdellovibrionota bacterium]